MRSALSVEVGNAGICTPLYDFIKGRQNKKKKEEERLKSEARE
jgi:hypothetical protein